jgi:hypothetical protein
MQLQVLDMLDVPLQPAFDIGIFRVVQRGRSVMLLNFTQAALVDLGEKRRKRYGK